MVFLASFFCFLCFVSSNLFVWWSVFLMMTILFVMLNKSSGSYSSLFNYFVIQESLGLFFLIFCFSVFQLFIVMMKIGVAPLHFWVFSVTNNVLGYGLLWFLTFQKLPFLFVLLQLFSSLVVYFLIFGFIFCYFQIFSLKNFKNMMIISSTESFSWIVLGCSLSFFNSIVLFFYYFFLMLFLINKFGKFNYNFIMLETVLVFLNIPFSVSFFVKIFSLGVLFNLDSFFILLVLFLMFLSVVSFSFWLINISTKTKEDFSLNSSSFYFLIYPMMLFLII